MCDACGMLNSYISSNQRNLCKVRLLFHHVTHDEDRKKAGFVDHKDYRACLCADPLTHFIMDMKWPTFISGLVLALPWFD